MNGTERVMAMAAHPDGAGNASASVASHQADATDVAPSAGERAPCQAPSQPRCCDAVASCSASVTVRTATQPTASYLLATVIPPAVAAIPLSRLTAPEPPPPKA